MPVNEHTRTMSVSPSFRVSGTCRSKMVGRAVEKITIHTYVHEVHETDLTSAQHLLQNNSLLFGLWLITVSPSLAVQEYTPWSLIWTSVRFKVS